MKNDFFLSLENLAGGQRIDLETVLGKLIFNEQGLIPVIAQDATTKTVLMLAWMNHDALIATLKTGRMTYWSRSRNELWVKGATSGHTQELVTLSIDCDGDALLCLIHQKGGACHTQREHCFYLEVDRELNQVKVICSPPE